MRFAFTARPGLTFARSKLAVRLLAVTDWRVSARPLTLTVTSVGALMTTRLLAKLLYWIGLTVKALKVGGFCAKATAPNIKTESPIASSLRRQPSVTQLTFAALGSRSRSTSAPEP